MWAYQGQVFSDEQSARRAALGDGWEAGAVPLDGSGTSFGKRLRQSRANSQGGQQYETVTETTEGSPGRLAQWAREGSAPVDYGYQAPDIRYGYQAPNIAYKGLTADQVRAAGGAGATRLLGAQQVYGDRADQLRADPSMTLLQRNYAGGLNTRELGQTSDAVNKEAEAAITALMSHQADKGLEAQALDAAGKKAVADKGLEAQMLDAAGKKAVADAVYAAGVRNSDLTSRDLKDLADIYTRMFGQYTTSSGNESSTSKGKTSGWDVGVSLIGGGGQKG
jgi:hypothetical protein